MSICQEYRCPACMSVVNGWIFSQSSGERVFSENKQPKSEWFFECPTCNLVGVFEETVAAPILYMCELSEDGTTWQEGAEEADATRFSSLDEAFIAAGYFYTPGGSPAHHFSTSRVKNLATGEVVIATDHVWSKTRSPEYHAYMNVDEDNLDWLNERYRMVRGCLDYNTNNSRQFAQSLRQNPLVQAAIARAEASGSHWI